MTSSPTFSGILFGAAYYAEYQPEGSVEHDLHQMVAAGFTVIRVGESVWSTWEPREGQFEVDWLQPVLDGAHARGISVILGTPTYAVPPWLQRMHPEIAAESSTGHREPWGGRQEMDQSHPAYRFYAERVARKVLDRYAAHPAVIGFQVDNEPGMQLPHNEHVFQRFVAWLQGRYGTVDALNEAWGLVYWSHRLSDWADLWRPGGNKLPEYQLEWRRFQASLATELISWQAEVVREYAREDQFVTTCISYSRPQVSDDELVRSLDVVAGNPYYRMQHGLDWDVEPSREELWWHQSVWALFQWGDRAWSSAQAQYLVTETNAQSVGGSWQNYPPYAGQLRQAAFALLARGGRMIEYWHWHTLHFGAEAYWGGVLPHSGRPGRIHREVAELGAALQQLGSALDDFTPDADVLMLWSTDSKWAFEFTPPLADASGGAEDQSYVEIFNAYYRGFAEVGAQVRIKHVRQLLECDPEELAAEFPVLVAPATYITGDRVLAALRAYAAAGGHLVLGIRTAYGDELGRVRRETQPALLSDAAGVQYDEYSNLLQPLPVTSTGDRFALEAGSAAIDWVEILHVNDAEVVVEYVPNPLGAEAALTSRGHGDGRISYASMLPNPQLARSIAGWAVASTAKQRWQAPLFVTVSTGCSGDRAIAFVSNWSGEATRVIAPSDSHDLVSGTRYAAGDTVPLAPRAALVLEVLDRPIG